MSEIELLIKPAKGHENDVQEFYKKHSTLHPGDVGFDLYCMKDITIQPRAYSVQMPLGVHIEAQRMSVRVENDTHYYDRSPTGFYMYPRSSTGSKTPIRLSNSVGIIDAGYRGELMALLDNVSDQPFEMKRGERYFQICGPELNKLSHRLVKELSETERGEGGFGSTGK